MKLGSPAFLALFAAELKIALRDTRTILLSIVLPIIVTPVLILSSNWVNQKRAEKVEKAVFKYAMTGAASESVRSHLQRALEDGREAAAAFSELKVEDAGTALIDKQIDFYVECTMGKRKDEQPSDAGRDDERIVAGAPIVTIHFIASRDISAGGARRMRDLLGKAREDARFSALRLLGIDLDAKRVLPVEGTDLADPVRLNGLKLGRAITPLLLFLLLSGCSVLAIDSIAGEKERGTLETLLTTALSRTEIIAAKQLIVLAAAILITVLQLISLGAYAAVGLIPSSLHLVSVLRPTTVMLLFLLYLPMAALISAILLLASSRARTYKEAQTQFLPVLLAVSIPGLASYAPGLELRSVMCILPIANISLAVRGLLAGSPDWPFTVLAWIVTALAAVWVSGRAAESLAGERSLRADSGDAGVARPSESLFPWRVVPWFALMWALILVISTTWSNMDIRWQLVTNILVVFVGGSLLMIRVYRVDVREALALRQPHPAVYLAVFAGAPAGLLTGYGLFLLLNELLPVPEEMLDSFSQAMLPEHIPFYQLVLMLTILPGIGEEIAFRGALLHGLSRRLRPITLVVVVGATFGLFHYSLFRFAPTAFLGMTLAAVTLLSGSIFPAMLWHALNNALGILAGKYEISIDQLDPHIYALGAVLLATAIWIIWRNRRPYPGLRPWRGTR